MSINRRLFGPLMQLFKGLIFLTQGLVSLIIVSIIIFLIGVSFDDEIQLLPENAALRISPKGILVDQKLLFLQLKNF